MTTMTLPSTVMPAAGKGAEEEAWNGATSSDHVEVVREPAPHLYAGIGLAWIAALVWFHPRLMSLMDLAQSPGSWMALGFFVVFIELAWLYGFYNIGVVIAAAVYRKKHSLRVGSPPLPPDPPPVALLYTTYNDFVEESVRSCVVQEYLDYHVYILDDSTDPACRDQVDAFAAVHEDRVTVVRRPDRRGFKAGNLNHALAQVAKEPFFALVDADEILPPDFLSRSLPYLLADPSCGFVQANHQANPGQQGKLPRSVAVGIDVHWRWYQPLRNRYGFVMLLGHGAVLRREAWEAVGGIPELVSEDLAFAVRLREAGWRGYFAEDIVCYEDFPDSVRAFRVRHMKWTRGTSEFIVKETGRLLRARNISWVEKLDILFPTLGLPLALFWFLYLVDANLVLASFFGIARPLTLALGGHELVFPTWGLDDGFNVIYGADFVAVTLLTFTAPILSFVGEEYRPLRLSGSSLFSGRVVLRAKRKSNVPRNGRSRPDREWARGTHPSRPQEHRRRSPPGPPDGPSLRAGHGPSLHRGCGSVLSAHDPGSGHRVLVVTAPASGGLGEPDCPGPGLPSPGSHRRRTLPGWARPLRGQDRDVRVWLPFLRKRRYPA
jgi:cellulose synthase/poly-beta-1,6-N-acetylglucosamine synthase-like glycosyltransferase